MNLQFINPFIRSTVSVISTMASMEINRGSASIAKDMLPDSDVTGIVSITSDTAKGVLAISFTQPVILEIIKNMFGDEPNGIDDNVHDLVGELTNMVYGAAKAELDEAGYNFDMAIPSVVTELDKDIDFPRECAVILVPMATEFGQLYVQISYENESV